MKTSRMVKIHMLENAVFQDKLGTKQAVRLHPVPWQCLYFFY